jgi:hypothetical protein
MGCAAIAFELLCIFRLKIIAQLPHSFKIPSPLPRNWNPFCRISVSWPHAADAAPGTRREKDERSATEAVFGFNYDNISNDPALCFQAQNAPIQDFKKEKQPRTQTLNADPKITRFQSVQILT